MWAFRLKSEAASRLLVVATSRLYCFFLGSTGLGLLHSSYEDFGDMA